MKWRPDAKAIVYIAPESIIHHVAAVTYDSTVAIRHEAATTVDITQYTTVNTASSL